MIKTLALLAAPRTGHRHRRLRGAIPTAILAAALGFASTGARADTTTYNLTDIGNFTGYGVANSGQTFSGTGFVGEYAYQEFAHLFGLEGTSSETNAQIGIAGLAGQTIERAVLSYTIVQNGITTGTVTITGYNSTGHLGYLFDAPTTDLGTATGTTHSTNTVDVTALVSAAVGNGDAYLGLLFQDSVFSNWTYTSPDANAAEITLTVTCSPVPEPASMALFGTGLCGLGLIRRRSA